MNKIIKLVCLVLYYGIARHLPEHSDPRGKLWKWIRATLARPLLKHAGEGFNVNHGVHFGKGDKLSLGKDGALGRDTRVIGTVTIGDYSGTADTVLITTMNRRFDSFDGPMMHQGKRDEKPIVIDEDVMIFARAMILAGVHIHQGCVIGAGAVVTKDVPPWAIVVGNPARVVKFRKNPPAGLDYARMTPIECPYTPE